MISVLLSYHTYACTCGYFSGKFVFNEAFDDIKRHVLESGCKKSGWQPPYSQYAGFTVEGSGDASASLNLIRKNQSLYSTKFIQEFHLLVILLIIICHSHDHLLNYDVMILDTIL